MGSQGSGGAAGRTGTVTAVVPLKALDQAKGRLAGRLDPAGRRELVAWMFARVLGACLGAAHVGSVLVVAGDEAAAELAAAHPRGGGTVGVLVEPAPGLARALAAADAATAAAPATVVVFADLPLLRARDVDAVCAAGSRDPCVVVVPTADGGTGALLRRPAGLPVTAFGVESAAAHVRLATEAGVPVTRLELFGFALDVDTAGQLRGAALLAPEMRRWSSALSSRQDQAPARSSVPPQVPPRAGA